MELMMPSETTEIAIDGNYGIFKSNLVYITLTEDLVDNEIYDSFDMAKRRLGRLLEEEKERHNKKIYQVENWIVVMPRVTDERVFDLCLKFGCDVAEWYEIKKVEGFEY